MTKQKESSKSTELKDKLDKAEAYIKVLELNFDTEVQKRFDKAVQDKISAGIESGTKAEIQRLKTQFNDEVERRVASRVQDALVSQGFGDTFDFDGFENQDDED